MKTMMIEKTQTMTSLEIAELTGKQHKHVMEAIRKMEPAWEKVHGSKFRLMRREVAIGNGAGDHPMINLARKITTKKTRLAKL